MGCIPSKAQAQQMSGDTSMRSRPNLSIATGGSKKQADGSLSPPSPAPWVSGHSKLIVEKDGSMRVHSNS
ncbi:hypothetical protein PM082_003378 [Marasmius tenuissimus]|nr:hypothetical protein PM082_003378 [Marasmius tenuissimus]